MRGVSKSSSDRLTLTLKRTGFLGDPIWNKGRQKCLLLFSKIINAITFKLSTKVTHLKYFKKFCGNTEGHVTFLLTSSLFREYSGH